MSEAAQEYEFDCPYCGTRIAIIIDLTGGGHQSFAYDCERCCRPIAIDILISSDGIISFTAEQE